MNRYVRLLVFVCISLSSTRIYSSHPSNPIIKFIIGINDDSIIVNKKITRAGVPIYRAYAFSTIQESGYYRLAGTVSNQITIAANNVQLNLGGNTVTGGIVINSNLSNITINNGTIIPGAATNAITVNSGCSSIKISDVSIQDSGVACGILLSSVTNSTIRNCDLIQNTTGIELNSCSNVTIQDCCATRSMFSGFSLLSSNTCTITGCKAISTGTDNTIVTLTTVLGFSSNNGVGNVFDRCIANSTQALTTTDSSSVIAGFALRGTEQGSRITNCTASNTATSLFGFTVPYGILLQATAATTLTLTGTPPVPVPIGFINSGAINAGCDWTPDGRFFATSVNGIPFLIVYLFDSKNVTLNMVAIPNRPLTQSPVLVRWSPDGQFLAVSGSNGDSTELRVYRFDPTNYSLTFIAQPVPNISGDTAQGLSWSPNGLYIALTANSAASPLRVFAFDPLVFTLKLIAGAPIPTGGGATIYCAWSPDNNYIATDRSDGLISVCSFNSSAGTLTIVATASGAASGGSSPAIVAWSPDGLYLALNGPRVYSFNRITNTLTQVASGGSSASAGVWSPDGRYLITNAVQVLFFNRNQGQLVPQASTTAGIDIRITGDGQFITSITNGLASKIAQYRPFTFPSQNVIMNNTVYCNSGNSANTQSGIGISGSSTSNYIVGNTVYSDPINPPIASINYAFVTNVFNPLFQDAPTLMQNISLGTCDPILLRRDQAQNFQILVSKLVDIATKVDLIVLK